jgi:hypothetical protein
VPERRGATAKLAVACVGALAVALALASSPACTLHNCDPTSSTFALGTQGIRKVYPDGRVELASSAFDGSWVDFPGGLTIAVSYPPWFTPDPAAAPAFLVSTGQAQDAGATSTPASGQLTQLSNLGPTGFSLNNGSCSEYYVWFSATGTGTPPATSTSDGGADAGADAAHD